MVLLVMLLLPGCNQYEVARGYVEDIVDIQGYTGKKYRPTRKVLPVFHEDQVPRGCQVFAHLLAWTPMGYSGKSIEMALSDEATLRGADLLLMGRSRRAEENQGLRFTYYGPGRPYDYHAYWSGWRFGYTDWTKQGKWVSIGYDEWGNNAIRFNYPLTIQAAFLRCRR